MNPPTHTKRQPRKLRETFIADRANVLIYFQKYLRMVRRRWYFVLIGLLLGGASATYMALKSPNIYRSSSKISIAPKIQTAFTSQVQYLEELNNFYDAQLQYIRSTRVMTAVEEKMHASRPVPMEGFYFSALASKGPGFFSLIVESTDQPYASRYASVWAQEFINFKKDQRENAIGKSAASMREEIASYEKKLAAAREVLDEFQKENKIASIKDAGDAAQLRLDKLLSEYQDIKTLRQRLSTKTPEEIAGGAQVDIPKSATPRNPESQEKPTLSESTDPLAKFATSSKYSELKLKLKSKLGEAEPLSLKLKPKHPYMIKLRSEISQIQEELKNYIDLIEEQRLARIKSLEGDESSYPPLIEKLRTEVQDSRTTQYRLERLKEEEGTTKATLDNLRKAYESLGTTAIEDGYFNILEEGIGSPLPVRPDRLKMILIGVALGLCAGFGLVYALAALDDRLSVPDEIEAALGQNVLGQVPKLDKETLARDGVLAGSLDPMHFFLESLRSVRSSIILSGRDPVPRVLMVTSTLPAEGKTTVSVNFAATLAQAGHTVLLIDADMRRGEVHKYFGFAREPGLADVLLGECHWDDVTHVTPFPGLKVLTRGKAIPNPSEHLGGAIPAQLLGEAKEDFEFIIIDMTPLTGINDAFSLVRLVEGMLFVVRAEHSPMRLARQALNAASEHGAVVLGVVVNAVAIHFSYYYHYYQDYYKSRQAPGAAATNHSAQAHPLVAKMAAPKKMRSHSVSISAAARTLAGEDASEEALLADEKFKAQQYNSRKMDPLKGQPSEETSNDPKTTV